MKVGLIWAMASNAVIGRDGRLPWHLPDDLKHFKAITLGHPVVMGRRTYQSVGKPLPGRSNLVLSRGAFAAAGVVVVPSLEAALEHARAAGAAWVWVIGGAAVYASALPLADRLEVTRVHAEIDGDVKFPAVEWSKFRCTHSEEHGADAAHPCAFAFERWDRR
jgi:dihydrofolate reductase